MGERAWRRVATRAFLVPLLTSVAVAVGGGVTSTSADSNAMFGLMVMSFFSTIMAVGTRLWARAVFPGFVFGLLMLALAVVAAPFGITRPDRFLDFTAALVMLTMPALAAFACLAAIIARRRPAEDTSVTGRRAVRALVLAMTAALIGSAALTAFKPPVRIAAGTPADVDMTRDFFLPGRFAAQAGDEITFRVHNEDSYAHTFTIDALEVDTYVGPFADRTVTVDVPEDAASSYRITCEVQGHERMTGALIVDQPRNDS